MDCFVIVSYWLVTLKTSYFTNNYYLNLDPIEDLGFTIKLAIKIKMKDFRNFLKYCYYYYYMVNLIAKEVMFNLLIDLDLKIN